MKFRYITIYQIKGLTHNPDEGDIEIYPKKRVLVVVYTERGSNIRIISCRKATPLERKLYEESGD